MVIVSHDREFLDQLCTKIVETEHGLATTYKYGMQVCYICCSPIQKCVCVLRGGRSFPFPFPTILITTRVTSHPTSVQLTTTRR